MNTPTAHPIRRRLAFADQETLRFRAELPAISTPRPQQRTNPTHDFLVPNPRPDLLTPPHEAAR